MSSADRIADLEALVRSLLERIAALKAENAALKEKLAKSSRNSSKPPSSDGPKEKAERRTKKPTGRAAGGQPGHPKHERPAWPAEKVKKRVVLRPKQCQACTSPLVGDDPEPHRHQLFELPKVEPIVTEFLQHSLGCKRCGHVTRAPLPVGVPSRIFGPSVDAAIGYLMGVHKLGKRGAAEALFDLYGLPISVGAIVDSQREVSEALAEPYGTVTDS